MVQVAIETHTAWALLSLKDQMKNGSLPDRVAGVFLASQPWFRMINCIGAEDTLPLLRVRSFHCPGKNGGYPYLLVLTYEMNGTNLGLMLTECPQRQLSCDPDSD